MAAPMKKLLIPAQNAFLCRNMPALTRRAGLKLARRFNSESGTANAVEAKAAPYDLYSGLIIERRPVITAELNDIEKRYQQLQHTIELEKSSYSKHELRHQADLNLAARRLTEEVSEKETSAILTAVDVEDMWTEEKSRLTLASRTTDADETGNKHTHHRCLDKCVYLLVKQGFQSGKSHWIFPQALSADGESTRETCDSILESLSSNLTVRHLGNAPSIYHHIKYPKNSISSADPQLGAKIFLHKVLLSDGDLTELLEGAESLYEDFCWLTSKEIQKIVKRDYWRSVKPALHEY